MGIPNGCGAAPRCDVDASGSVSVIDAQFVLRMAVGTVDGICAPVQELRFRIGSIPEDSPLSMFPIDVDFPGELGSFVGSDGRAHCTNPFSPAVPAASEVLPGGLLVSLLSFEGFSGEERVVACKFDRTGDAPVAKNRFRFWADAESLSGDVADPTVTLETP